ncbi:MAG: serine/threonine protein kinase [Candidatus Sulfopaludibacter sp.]|nr:serine/threonine protein kinase [Candidatus Sulfopaludibacter sp.]
MDRIGRYKIVRELGRGAMGVVYHAIDPNIGRPVAIKTIRLADVANGEEQKRLRERLFREARSAGMLSHPGIVTIYDVEEQDGVAYIAMEYVDGPTLDQVLSGPTPITPEGMFSILAQTAAALDYAHGKSIVHRDIKPANIMIAGDGTAKIADFGIAKITTSEQFTMTGSIVGTPHYMSPEQVQGQAVDGRSDQFSLAVIAYEMLTGEKPYTGEHLTTVVYKIVAEEPVAPHRVNPSLSAGIENVIRKGLSKKADQRYATCQEFVEALEKACGATKNWKAMPRGGSLSEPTIADAGVRRVVTLPPARKPVRSGDATTTAERGAKQKSGFVPFLLAILMAAALLMLIGWQAIPWLNVKHQPQQAQTTADTPADTKAPPSSQPPAPAQPGASGNAADAKPSPMPAAPAAPPPESAPAETKPPETKPPETRAPAVAVRAPAMPQPVSIISSPGGASATIDGQADATCRTPCTMDVAPGRHTLIVAMPGYQVERREFEVGHDPPEIPAVTLHAITGTLMLSSSPTGANILVNGKRIDKVTNAMLQLAPGSYKITVEKDGKQGSDQVDIRNGEIKTLRILLGQ